MAAVPTDHWIFENQNSLVSAIHRAALRFLDADDPRDRSISVALELKGLQKAAKAAEAFLTALEECGAYDPDADHADWMEQVAEFPHWVTQVVEQARGRRAKPPHVYMLPAGEPDRRGGRIPPWDEFLRDICVFWTHTLGLKATRSRDRFAGASGNMVDFVYACGEPIRLRPSWMSGKGPMTPEIALKAIEDFKIYSEENMPDPSDPATAQLVASIKGDMA